MATTDNQAQLPADAPAQAAPEAPEADPKEVVRAVQRYVREADQARQTRMQLNRRNRSMLLGLQDWSHKIEGQSAENIPKIGEAIEHFTAVIRRGLASQADWFSVEIPENPVLTSDECAKLLQAQLDKLGEKFVAGGGRLPFFTLIGDGVKQGLLESLVIFKIHAGPADVQQRVMKPDGTFKEFRPWRVKADLIRTEDYAPDPSGNGLYEVHTVWIEPHEAQRLLEQGVFDNEEITKLKGSSPTRKHMRIASRSEAERGQNEPTSRRSLIRIDECWGTLVGDKGQVIKENCVAAVADERLQARSPEANPYWHGESCFVVSPILRVPHSVWHRALYDDASALNMALNELFNLVLDGGLAAVWGIKELRIGMLEDVSQVAGGIPQGTTLLIKDDAPADRQALSQVKGGDIPREALALYSMIDREFLASTLGNETKIGMLPPKQVKATELVEASQTSASTMDSIVSDIETLMIPSFLRKVWLTVLQNVERMDAREIMDAIGPAAMARLASVPPHVRFNELARATFKVYGISGMMARARDFQKLLGFVQVVFSNPVFAQIFLQKYDISKLLDALARMANLKLDSLKITAPQQGPGGPGGVARAMFSSAGGTPPGGGSLPNPENMIKADFGAETVA